MDGSPSRGTAIIHGGADTKLIVPGETIPIRLFLGGFDLTPTFREVNKKYSTRYYLSLVLIDEGSFILFPARLVPAERGTGACAPPHPWPWVTRY